MTIREIPDLARRRKGRSLDGVLLLDKPGGVSSNHILQRMKHLFGAAKAGHTGALDPLATGMLPICFGEATKFSQFLLDADKRYITTAKLGVKTASGDADGEVLEEKPVGTVTREQVEALLHEHFNGEITQTPSMYSALKHQGQPLYKLARKGIEVPVKQRQVTIYEIHLLDVREDELDLDVRCSKGTYIRSIVEDLGELLGCGAHVKVLRRLESGPYKAEQMLTPEQLFAMAEQVKNVDESEETVHQALDQVLLPPWSAVESLPRVDLDQEQTRLLQNGRKLVVDLQSFPVGLVCAFHGQQFIGLAEVSEEGLLVARRLASTQ